MAIKGVIFDYQSPTAKNFGALFHTLGDCIANGCTISGSGSTVSITAGMLIIGGRAIEITSTESISVSGTGYVRIVCNVDLSGAATTSSFSQAYFSTQTAASLDALPALTQNDVNMNGTLYQAEVAVFAISSNVISSKTRQLGGILAGAIGTAELEASSVTSDKIASGAVTTGKLDSGAVTSGKIASGAVTAEKLASGAVTPASIGAATSNHTHTPASIGAAASSHTHSADDITSGTFGTARIADGAVTRAKMSTNIILTSGVDYGTTTSGQTPTAGRIFFVKV